MPLIISSGEALPPPSGVYQWDFTADDLTVDEGVPIVFNVSHNKNSQPSVPSTFHVRQVQNPTTPPAAATGADFNVTLAVRIAAAVAQYNDAHPADPPATSSQQGTGIGTVQIIQMPATWDGTEFSFTRGAIINAADTPDRQYGLELIAVSPGVIMDGVEIVASKAVTVVIHNNYVAPSVGILSNFYLGTTPTQYATAGPYCLRDAAEDADLSVPFNAVDTDGATVTGVSYAVVNNDSFARFKIASSLLKVGAVAPDFEGPPIAAGNGVAVPHRIPFYRITVTATKDAASVEKQFLIWAKYPLITPAPPVAPTTSAPTTSAATLTEIQTARTDNILNMADFTGVVEGFSGVPQIVPRTRSVILGHPEELMIKNGSFTLRGSDLIVRNQFFATGAALAGVSKSNRDAFNGHGIQRVIFRNCAFAWGIDGNMDITAQANSLAYPLPKDIWIDYCVVFNPLRRAAHSTSEPVHAFNGMHNYFNANMVITNTIWGNSISRNPSTNGGLQGHYVANCLQANNGTNWSYLASSDPGVTAVQWHGATQRNENNLLWTPASAYPYPVISQANARLRTITVQNNWNETDFAWIPPPGHADANHFISHVSGTTWNFADDPVDRTVHKTILSTAPNGAAGLCNFRPFEHSAAAIAAYNVVQMNSPAAREAKFWDLIDNCGPGLLVDPEDYTSPRVTGRENATYLVYEFLELLTQGITRFETGGARAAWPDGLGGSSWDAALDSTYDRFHTPAPPHSALLPWAYRSDA